MYKSTLFLGICLAFTLGSKLTIPSKDSEKIVGCYHVINDPYNDPQPELEEKGIDVSLCTHLFYSFVGIGSNGSVLNDGPYSDRDFHQFPHFNRRWKKNPRIKTLAHITNLNNDYSDNSEGVLTDPHQRGKVVNNVVNFVKKYVFNGIDLDLSNILNLYKRPTDKENLVLLLKALKEKFDKEGFILSVSVDPREDTAKMVYDIKGISMYVNFINLMAFKFHGPMDQENKFRVGHNSPLYHSLKENAKESKKNIDYVVRYWIQNGAPANKLILGTALSGVSYTLADPKQIGRGALFIKEGKYPHAEYSKICAWSRKLEWNYFYDKEQQVPYIYKGNQILAIDDVHSMKAKAEYVNKMKLGGAVVQYLDQDDFGGKCGEKFAILKTLNRILRNKS